MKHHSHCTCAPGFSGVLLPRIIASEHRHFNHLCTRLCADLPACLPAPLRLTAISACGTPVCTPSCGGCHIRIPVVLHICDGCGRPHTASSAIEVETGLPTAMCEGSLYVQPHVELCCACECANGCFEATVHLSLCIYHIRLEPCMTGKPACPQLPLYPQPRM